MSADEYATDRDKGGRREKYGADHAVKRKMTNASPKAALARSLGNDGSCERLPHTCALGWVANGRSRCQIFAIT